MEACDKLGFSILSLIQPLKGCGVQQKDSSLWKVEHLLDKTSDNLTKVNNHQH